MTATTRTDTDVVVTVARLAYRAGLCVVPPAEDGSKRPEGAWRHWQQERPDRATMRGWYDAGRRSGVGVVCGAISGNLEAFEFDDHDTYRAFYETAADIEDMRELLERIAGGYEETSPGGGIHWLYRCETIAGNTKLAERPGPPDEAGNPTREPLIETRGEGGYIVLAPSHGPVHPSGKPYALRRGSVATIAAITAAERAALWNLARSFDQMPAPEPEPAPEPRRTSPAGSAPGERPGDAFERQATWAEILEPHGWRALSDHGGVTFWRRPGKPSNEPGHSAISGYRNPDGADRFVCYSTSTAFDAGMGYSKFRAYALLEHGGDWQAAARELGRQGYGKPAERAGATTYTQNGNGGMPPADEPTPAQPERSVYPLTDTGNAERLAARYGQDIRFNWETEAWHVWTGRHWERDRSGRMLELSKSVVRAIPDEARGLEGEPYTKMLKWAAASESAGKRAAMIDLARSEPQIPVQPHELDADPWLLNVANGTLDLRTGRLREHRREDLITRLVDVPYNPATTCPRFLGMLDRILAGDAELIGYVQRMVGYSLTGSIREQTMLICYGTGSNGKSTLVGIIRRLLGDYAQEADADSFMERRSDAIREDIAALDGARFVAASETGDDKRLSEALVKKMTGGEQLRARRLYENGYTFAPQFKVWLSTNHRPTIVGTEHAIWRRIRLIPFNVTIPDGERDLDLPAKLEAELPGILAWAVRGCLDWQRDGERPPASVLEATRDYQRDMDIIGNWLEDRCELRPGVRETPRALYDDYVAYCETAGETPIKQRTFGMKLTARGCGEEKSSGIRYRTGIRLYDPERHGQAPLDDGGTQGTLGSDVSGNPYRDTVSRDFLETNDPYVPNDPPPTDDFEEGDI